MVSPGCCCCPGPPGSCLWAQRWYRQWRPRSGPPACSARHRGRTQGWACQSSALRLGANQVPADPWAGTPFPQASLTCSSSRKRRKAGTRSSCCSNPCPVCTSPRGGSKTWYGAQGAIGLSLPLGPPRSFPAYTPLLPYLVEDM
jgi:hypothetical protein